LPRFIGSIQQRPPIYSALKLSGRRACDRVRAGEQVELQPRTVMVYGMELLKFEYPFAQLRIDCGRGTYIRSIARDLGEALNVGGYLTGLRRTKIGDFMADQSVSLETLTPENISKLIHPISD
jgi:tRNA pseudouridine55 synthase